MKHKGMTAEEAQAYLLQKRPQVNPRIKNRTAVKQFEAKLRLDRTTVQDNPSCTRSDLHFAPPPLDEPPAD